jgi:hypothetical protein
VAEGAHGDVADHRPVGAEDAQREPIEVDRVGPGTARPSEEPSPLREARWATAEASLPMLAEPAWSNARPPTTASTVVAFGGLVAARRPPLDATHDPENDGSTADHSVAGPTIWTQV